MRDENVKLDKDGKSYLNVYGDVALDDTRTNNLPEVHPVMAEMRAAIDKFDSNKFPGTRVLIGETYLPNIQELEKQYGSSDHPEFHLPMDTQVLEINKMDAAAFRAKLTDAEEHLDDHTPLFVFDNHDNPRLDLRYGDGIHNTDIQRVLSTVLFASRGAALFYYGDEIGMKTTPPIRKEDVKDPVGLTGWPKAKGRDGERTPMQWDASAQAGFSSDPNTWLPIPPDYASVNVKTEEANPDSLFAWYQSLIRLKRTNPALATGSESMLDAENPNVLSWVRKGPNHLSVIVSVNFKAEPQTVSLSVPGPAATLKTLLKTPGGSDPASPQSIQLGPYGVYVGELTQ
jgi:alpha-glucosidase